MVASDLKGIAQTIVRVQVLICLFQVAHHVARAESTALVR